MLASPGGPASEQRLRALAGTHLFDLKHDGVHCVATVRKGSVVLTNRRGATITGRYPDVALALAERFATTDVTLDGELVVIDADGRPSFAAIHRRDAQQRELAIEQAARRTPATFVAFDLLHLGWAELRGETLETRLGLLAGQLPQAGGLIRRSVTSNDGVELWTLVCQFELEGLIAKRRDAPYRPGRSRHWLKFKRVERILAVAVGYEEGEGARAGKVGALKLMLVGPDNTLIDIGKVGTGLNEADLADCKQRLDDGRWFVVIVEASGRSENNLLRFPSFKGIATGVDPVECRLDQLDALPIA